MKKHRGMTTVRRPMGLSRIKRSDMWLKLRIGILITAVSAGVLAVILFGFPLIEDLIKGVDPSLRYQPKVESNFIEQEQAPEKEEIKVNEIYFGGDDKIGSKILLKNEPYLDNKRIIFTTELVKSEVTKLDSVVLYDTQTETQTVLPNVEKKYDNLLSPMLSGNIAVWIDSLEGAGGGGRIVGYDLDTNEQFEIKEYAYAMPKLSIAGDYLAFMQRAGEKTQRLYVYNIKTREAATVKLFEDTAGNSDADISLNDMVWAEKIVKKDGTAESILKRIVFENGVGKYDNYDFGKEVYHPKTNGRDIVFSTSENGLEGSLMLSVGGNAPAKIAEGALNYDIGNNYVVYTKDDAIVLCYTDMQRTDKITGDITKNLLASANGNAICFYDITDKKDVLNEIVKYAFVN